MGLPQGGTHNYCTTMGGTNGRVIAKPSEYYYYSSKPGKIFELILDCKAAKLYMNTPNGKQHYVELPKWSKYIR